MDYKTINKTFCTEFCSWPEQIDIHISDALKDHVEQARSILKYNQFVQSVKIEVPKDFYHPESFITLQTACRFEDHSIIIEDIHTRFFLESKWSKTITAEYDLSDLLPHPEIEKLNIETDLINEEVSPEIPRLFEVQTYTDHDGWINTWSVIDEEGNESLQRFKSREDAQNEIDDYRAQIQEDINQGFDVTHDNMRIVEIKE